MRVLRSFGKTKRATPLSFFFCPIPHASAVRWLKSSSTVSVGDARKSRDDHLIRSIPFEGLETRIQCCDGLGRENAGLVADELGGLGRQRIRRESDDNRCKRPREQRQPPPKWNSLHTLQMGGVSPFYRVVAGVAGGAGEGELPKLKLTCGATSEPSRAVK